MKKRNFTKRKMSMRIVALTAVFALAVGTFVGCDRRNATEDEKGRTRVSVSWPQKQGAALDNAEAKKSTFEAQNPDVIIEKESWTFDIKTFYAKAAGGQLPTVFAVPFTEVPQMIASGYCADINDVLKKRGYEGKFSPLVLDLVSKDDKVYAFPFEAYMLGLAYNTDMLKAAGLMEEDGTPKQPKDWYEVAEFAQKIKSATGKPGFVFPTAGNSGGWIFTCLAWSFGTKFMEQGENGKWKATFNSPEAAEALQYIKDLKWKYDVLPANTLVDHAEYYKTFSIGNAGMCIAAGDVPLFVSKYGMQPEELGIMALPAGPAKHVTLLGGKVNCIAATATEKQIDAAIRWMETTYNYNITDEYKENTQKSIEAQLGENQLVGIKGLRVWSDVTESVAYLNSQIDKYTNVNPNHVRLYNEFVSDASVERHLEEPVCAQELYGILDNCLQEVLNNENADCATLLENANSDFQINYLDNLDY